MEEKSSFITYTLESETTEERYFWDLVIRALDKLCDISPDLDLIEILEDLKDEYREDAAMLIYNYYINIDTDVGEYAGHSMEVIEELLIESGLLEKDSETE